MTSMLAELAMVVSTGTGWSILVKATLLLSLGFAAAWLARRQRASVRHMVLAATLATLLVLPVLSLFAPAVSVAVPIATRPATTGPTTVAPQAAARTGPTLTGHAASSGTAIAMPSPTTLGLGVWVGGALLIVIAGGLDVWRVRRLVRTAVPWTELPDRVRALAVEHGLRSVDVLRHQDVVAPFVWGVWRPTVVLPAMASEWTREELERALVHELEHVRRRDWAVQFGARLICAGYWLHPLVWVAWRRLCLEAERACDDAVVQRAEGTDYAEQLVSMAERLSSAKARAVLGMANRSELSRRVAALLDATQRRGRAGALVAACVVTAAAIVGIPVALMRAVAISLPAPHGQNASVQRFIGSWTMNPVASEFAGAKFDITRFGDSGFEALLVLPDGSTLRWKATRTVDNGTAFLQSATYHDRANGTRLPVEWLWLGQRTIAPRTIVFETHESGALTLRMPDLQLSGTAQLDGADYPFFGPRMPSTSTVAMTLVDPATLALLEKFERKNGTLTFRTTYQVSEDGASLRRTVVSASLPAARATIAYDRQ